MTIALASDHTGYEQLLDIQKYLAKMGYTCHNFGPNHLDPNDDYPDFVSMAAKAVASGHCELGIILGGSGQGEAMAANRFKRIRCAVFYGPAVPKGVVDIEGKISHDPYEIVKLSREHNNANILSIASRFVGLEEMKYVIKLWIETPFSGVDRHERRIKKIDGLS